jgi:uncharacterized membrane protein YdjX (TVP38/TMEM64 family)
MENKSSKIENRVFVFLVICVTGSISYALYPDFFFALYRLISTADVESASEFLRSYGSTAAIISFLILVFINAVGVLPNFFFLAANGIIFGVIGGTLLSWAGELVGAVIGFAFLRYLFRDYAEQFVKSCGASHHTQAIGGHRGFQLILLTRAIPYMPSGLITALSAVSSVSLRDYALATAIGKLPSVWLEVTLGHDIVSYKEHMFRLSLLILVSVAAFIIVWWYRRRQKCQS